MTIRNTLAPLTSLRFFAAGLVLAHHAGVFSPGYVGVTFFFVLSGFILAYNYTGKLETRAEHVAFARRRFARIYPAHLLTLVLALPLVLGPGAVPTAAGAAPVPLALSALANLLLLQSWFPARDVFFGFNAVSWSISDEAFFYLLFPLLLFLFARNDRRSSYLVLGLWGAALVALALGWTLRYPAPVETDPQTHYLFYIQPGVRLFEFALGVFCGWNWVTRPGSPLGLGAEIAAIGLFIATFAVRVFLPIPFPFAASLLFIPASLAMIVVFARSTGPLAALLGHPVLLLLGKASFMLYMIHQLTIRYAVLALGDTLAVHLAAAALAIPLSIALHLAYEEPLERRLSGRSRRREVAATAP